MRDVICLTGSTGLPDMPLSLRHPHLSQYYFPLSLSHSLLPALPSSLYLFDHMPGTE